MIKHNKPTLEIEEQQAAVRAIQSGWIAQGSEVTYFENELCDFLGLPEQHAVAVSSGTAALFMALWALQAEKKTVAIPVYACSALRNAIGLAHAEEILVDITEESPNICLNSVRTSNADIVIAPHLFGLPSNLKKLDNIDIIEDCAQAIGASVLGVPVGLQGKIGVFSFYASKLITSGGQGGMLVSRDSSLISAVRDFRNFDCRKDHHLRFNFQMTDIQAAIGRVQLKKLPLFLSRRNEIFEMYRQAGLDLLGKDIDSSARYRAVIKTPDANKIMTYLFKKGIQAIVPLEDWELLGDSNLFPNAFRLTQETLSLPIYPSLTNKNIEYILSNIRVFK